MKKHIINYIFIFTGVLMLSLFVNNVEVNAESSIVSYSGKTGKLVKVDTQGTGVESEIYLDDSILDDAQIFINDVRYVVKDGKLVKDNSNSIAIPFADYRTSFTLKNGRSGLLSRDALKGTPMNWTSYGPEETRLMTIFDYFSGKTLGQLSGNDYGVGLTITAPTTGTYGFRITNYSAATQTWTCRIRF